jgi:hypothetical protein
MTFPINSEGNTKMYKILFQGKRFNSKKFCSYEDARQYVRRKVTQLFGGYNDGYTHLGFQIKAI